MDESLLIAVERAMRSFGNGDASAVSELWSTTEDVTIFGAFGGLLLCISLYGQLGEGWSPIHAGLTLTPMVVGMILGMTGSNAAVRRLGRHLLHLGILLIAAGTAGLALTLIGARTASTGPRPRPVVHRRGCRRHHRAALPIYPDQREHGRDRIRLGCL